MPSPGMTAMRRGMGSEGSARYLRDFARAFWRFTLFACLPRAVRTFLGSFEIVFLRRAARAAFLMFLRAAVVCFGLAMPPPWRPLLPPNAETRLFARRRDQPADAGRGRSAFESPKVRSEEHTSELQSRRDLVCRLLLEKKKNISINC